MHQSRTAQTGAVGVGRVYDQLSVSVGVAISEPGCAGEALLQRADNLMYAAKRRGKDCVTMDGDVPQEAAQRQELQLRSELSRALDRDEFVVHFQPIVALDTAKSVAAEALLRWQHPRRGLLLPGEFLTVAEASAHLPAIGRRISTRAAARPRCGPAACPALPSTSTSRAVNWIEGPTG